MSTTDVLERLEGVRTAPGGWVARCPAHADRSPSLSIGVGEEQRVLLRCFAGCDTADVVAAIGLTMKDLAGDADVTAPRVERKPVERPQPLPEDLGQMREFCDAAASRLAGPAGDHAAVQYAGERFGLTLKDVHRLRLGYAPYLGGAPRLVVPFMDAWGVPRGMQARAISGDPQVRWLSPRSPAQGTWNRWGWFDGPELRAPVVVTEGPGDALTAVALGFNAIAIRGAGNASDEDTQRAVASVSGRSRIIVAGDGDEPGRRFTTELVDALHRLGAWVAAVQMPDGMDLTDLRRADERIARSVLATC